MSSPSHLVVLSIYFYTNKSHHQLASRLHTRRMGLRFHPRLARHVINRRYLLFRQTLQGMPLTTTLDSSTNTFARRRREVDSDDERAEKEPKRRRLDDASRERPRSLADTYIPEDSYALQHSWTRPEKDSYIPDYSSERSRHDRMDVDDRRVGERGIEPIRNPGPCPDLYASLPNRIILLGMIDRYVPPPTPPLTNTRPDRRVQPSNKGANYRQDTTYLPSKPVWEGDDRSSKRNTFFLIVKSTMRPDTRYYDGQEPRIAPRGPSRPRHPVPLQTETRQRAPLPPQSVALLMQQTRQPSRLTQQPSVMDMVPSSHREERRDAPIAPRADRERAREREQQRRSPHARVEDLTSPIHEPRSTLGNQGRNMYASRTERMGTRSSDIQEHDSRRVSPYGVSHGRDTLADNGGSDPVLPSTYHSTPPPGPSNSRGRGMLRTHLFTIYGHLTDTCQSHPKGLGRTPNVEKVPEEHQLFLRQAAITSPWLHVKEIPPRMVQRPRSV